MTTTQEHPGHLYERPKQQAPAHRRSVNGELIHCLETIRRPKKITAEKRLKRIRGRRPRIDPQAVSAEEVLKAIDEGRS